MNKSTCEYLSLESICTKGSSNISINKLNDCNGIYPLYGASGFVKDIDFFHQEKPYIGIVKDGAGVGRVSIYPAKSSLVGTMQYIIPSSKCTINYLYHFLCSLNLSKFVSGATIPHIYFKDYGKCLIPIPTIEEQGMIASELDMITEMISKYDEQLKELDKLSQSIFYEMFGDPVENEKGWEVKKLGNVSNVKTGPFGSLLHKSDYVDGCVPLINPIHIKDFKIVIDNSFTLTNEKASELSDYLLKENDVIFARRGDIGRCAIVSSEEQGCLCGTGSLFVRFLDGISPTFTMYIVRSISFVNELISKAKGSTMLNLNSKTMEDLSIILPPLPLQQSFARKIEAIEAMKSKVKEAKKEAETLLAARMQYWFE